uniref:MATH domain-containing protein n=1 Tax=Caenorhabditis tropicalis TaxID=1561998 RepID=A0A1I7T925_9PELO
MDTETTANEDETRRRKTASPEIDVDGLKSDCSSPERIDEEKEKAADDRSDGSEQEQKKLEPARLLWILLDLTGSFRSFEYPSKASPEPSEALLDPSLIFQTKNTLPPPTTQRARTSSSTSDGTEALIATLSAWDWVTIDGLQLPAVSRNKERYVAVHMVQLKLLSKFPSHIPPEITRKFTMGSHKMSVSEAWTFNSINAVIRKFDLGCQLFTADDELVKLNDVQMFYWNVKLFNLQRVNSEYETAIRAAEHNIQLLATAMQLKQQVENDIL